MTNDTFDEICDKLARNIAELESRDELPRFNECLTKMMLTVEDLAGIDLSDENLQKADLRKADLRWAKLEGTDLREADLKEADLRGASLLGANFQGANLVGAVLERHTAESLGYWFIPTNADGIVQITSNIENDSSVKTLLNLITKRAIDFLRISNLAVLEEFLIPPVGMSATRRTIIQSELRGMGVKADTEGSSRKEVQESEILEALALLPHRWVPLKATSLPSKGAVSLDLYDKSEGKGKSADYGELSAELPDVKNVHFDSGIYGKSVELDRLGVGRLGLRVHLKLTDASLLQGIDFGFCVDGEGEHGLNNLKISLF